MPRLTTLDYKEHEENSRVTFPITYHPNLRNLQKTVLEKYNNILLRDPEKRFSKTLPWYPTEGVKTYKPI